MKTRSLIASAAIAGSLMVGSSAFAAGITLPTGPIWFQYSNVEQFSQSNSLASNYNSVGDNATGKEGNWGIVQLSTIYGGVAQTPTGSDIQKGSNLVFADGNGQGQILGIFYGGHVTGVNSAGQITLVGGVLDLYYWAPGTSNAQTGIEEQSAPGAKRTAQNQYTGFTCVTNSAACTFLGEFDFSPGINSTVGDTTTTDITSVNPANADGVAKTYLDVNTAKGGAWATQLNTNYFTLNPNNTPFANYGLGAKDIRLDTNFNHGGAGAWSGPGTDTVGLQSNDPGRTYAQNIPEPGSLALFGTALLGAGLMFSRRNRKSI